MGTEAKPFSTEQVSNYSDENYVPVDQKVYPQSIYGGISIIIKQLLTLNPKQRITANEALKSVKEDLLSKIK